MWSGTGRVGSSATGEGGSPVSFSGAAGLSSSCLLPGGSSGPSGCGFSGMVIAGSAVLDAEDGTACVDAFVDFVVHRRFRGSLRLRRPMLGLRCVLGSWCGRGDIGLGGQVEVVDVRARREDPGIPAVLLVPDRHLAERFRPIRRVPLLDGLLEHAR